MKLTLDEIITIARRFEIKNEIPEVLEEFLNLIAIENENKKKVISDNQEFGEDFLIAAVKVLNRKEAIKA